jgi:GTP-binding protein HflX
MSPDEFIQLCESSGANCVFICQLNLRNINPRTYLSKGLLEYLNQVSSQIRPDIIIFSHELQAKHQKNLVETLKQIPISDINEVILDIFAKRAQSHIGKVQVELAQMQHLATRLVGGWTHLERQKGGIGLRGPGEKQLETDRRLLKKRITKLEQDLEALKTHRRSTQKKRRSLPIFQVALVGYTNAGKSTLFNQLTGQDAFTADQLFATLDPMVRKFKNSENLPICISDTVGFMSNLPQVLMNAFHATLDEVCDAHLILHVIDASDPQCKKKEKVVIQTLKSLDINLDNMLTIYNKIDVEPTAFISEDTICISAKEGTGLSSLKTIITDCFKQYTP